MDNLRAVIKNLFCHISPQEILSGNTVYSNVTKETFEKLGSSYIAGYSNDELYNMYFFLESEFFWQNRKLRDEPPDKLLENENGFNVFDALTTFNNAVLLEDDGTPVCQYIQILRWRDMIVDLEEDLFITSYLAYKDGIGAKEREDFFWKPVIGHNNKALNRLVAQGVAENHFHMKGSAPYFHLTWISLMNQIDNRRFQEQMEVLESNRLQRSMDYNMQYRPPSLSHMWRQAALIRLFLFNILEDFALKNDKDKVSADRIRDILKDEHRLLDESGEIQLKIELFRDNVKNELDYTICKPYLVHNLNKGVNEILSGERWFMYQCFRRLYRGDIQDELVRNGNLFYLYLVIKANIRSELIQANKNVGFDNFQRYQDRKDVFIDDTPYEKAYLKMAVRDTIYNQHIDSLEARIAPRDSANDMLAYIEKYDKAITKGMEDEDKDKLLKKYFYVVHFIKKSEHCIMGMDDLERYRHYRKRKSVAKQARAIAELRNGGKAEAARIHGIDACSPEIWCRPEIFGQTFRFLKNHMPETADKKYAECFCTHLMATYHVGEDFLDIIDGLRAIDEAIRFLNLCCGDRLGHALALGVDIDEWYEGKLNRILVNKMGYLDNLVWLHAKIRKYRIKDCNVAVEYIERRFDEYFKEIYRNNMTDEMLCYIMEKAKTYYDGLGVQHGYNHRNLNFGINEYYDAWKLRGDNPVLYENGYLQLKGHVFDEWDEYAINKEYPLNYKIRYNPETAILYYMYHYNTLVKLVGDQMVEVHVNDAVKDAVKKVRRCMQKEISDVGICIETNPSSNYLIGTFRRYDKHPISKWYNLGLTYDAEKINACPQLQVSINTDDQGVFATYIENEYAYLALAMEKATDSNGDRIYNRTMILQWLDNIRKNGINQCF